MKATARILAVGVALLVASAMSASAQPKVNDAQIAAVAVAANQVDVDAGKLAMSKAKNGDVKKFAQTMVTDHSGAIKAASDLVTKLKVTPQENDTSKALVKGGQDARAKLSKLDGDAFDKAYIDNEVAYHQAVIDALDKTLIPNAQNAELKALLEKSRPAFVAHLNHAKEVQSKIGTN
jgi:putative membrane protein